MRVADSTQEKKPNYLGKFLIFLLFYWVELLSRISEISRAVGILKDGYKEETQWARKYQLRLLLVSAALIFLNSVPLLMVNHFLRNDIQVKYTAKTPLMALMKKRTYENIARKRGVALSIALGVSVAANIFVFATDEVRRKTKQLKKACDDVGGLKSDNVLWTPAFIYVDTYGVDKKSLQKNEVLWQAAAIRVNVDKLAEGRDPRHTLFFQGVPLAEKYIF